MKFRSVLAAAMMLSASAFQASACTVTSPMDAQVITDLGTAIGGGGSYDLKGTADCPDAKDGKDGLNGRDFDASEALAVSAALSTPVWLGDSENFAVSGGLGFSDDATAVGANGVMRFSKNLSGFAGGAFSTDDSDLWAGKVGLRAGF